MKKERKKVKKKAIQEAQKKIWKKIKYANKIQKLKKRGKINNQASKKKMFEIKDKSMQYRKKNYIKTKKLIIMKQENKFKRKKGNRD